MQSYGRNTTVGVPGEKGPGDGSDGDDREDATGRLSCRWVDYVLKREYANQGCMMGKSRAEGGIFPKGSLKSPVDS